MPITDYATYKSLLEKAAPSFYYKITAGDAGRLQTSWSQAPFNGSTPSTAVACNDTTTGAMNFQALGLIPAPTKTRRLAYLSAYQVNNNTISAGTLVLIDRLSHQGGLNATVTTAQTTNLPTAALTRYTDGEGVWAALEVYTQIGATGTTATVSYTNQAGVSGRTSPAFVFGGTGYRAAGNKVIIPLQDGDTGVRSVESVTLVGTTGTAGNFGVTLFKPLDWLQRTDAPLFNAASNGGCDAFLGGGGLCPVIQNNACIEVCSIVNATTAPMMMMMKFIEDDA